jgi:hypothetical protein
MVCSANAPSINACASSVFSIKASWPSKRVSAPASGRPTSVHSSAQYRLACRQQSESWRSSLVVKLRTSGFWRGALEAMPCHGWFSSSDTA